MLKKLLCVSSRRLTSLHDLGLDPGQWQLVVVPTFQEAACMLAQQAFTVGVLVDIVGVVDDARVHAFLRAHPRIQWIGLVEARCLATSGVAALIADHLYDYHTMPADPVRLAHSLGHAHGLAALRSVAPPVGRQGAMIGSSPALMRLAEKIVRVAAVEAPVLISGPSGSGKELAAHAIHAQSSRRDGPFIAINCGALAPELIHAALFGHERGAFTGADKAKAGLIEAAHGGTIFLDEIGDLPKPLQVYLLRFLQEHTITRVGSTLAIGVDARIVAASHVDLDQAVIRGDFREDLFYRLAVLPLRVPPLRERSGDIPMLAQHFFMEFAAEGDGTVRGFSRSALDAMAAHGWPGNVRELMNRVRRAVVLAEGAWIAPEDLGFAEPASAAVHTLAPVPQISQETVRAALVRTGHNLSKTARELGISRSSLYRLLKAHRMAA